MALCMVCPTRADPSSAGLPRPVGGVVFAGSGILSTEGSQRRVRRSDSVDLRVHVKCRLVGPDLGQGECVRVEGALKDLIELYAAIYLAKDIANV
jgi:hypothetical protein